MRGVLYALAASVALMVGALTPASAGCYGECNGYRDFSGSDYRDDYGVRDRVSYSSGRYGHRDYYDGRPRGHTVYYERGPEIQISSYDEPRYRTAYYGDGYRYGYGHRYGYGYGHRYGYGYGYSRYRDEGYYGRPYRTYYRSYGYGYGLGRGYGYGGCGCGGYGNYGPRYVGGWSQTAYGYGYGGWGGWGGGCHTAYIPYGWTWYRATSC